MLTRVGWVDGVTIASKTGIIRFDPISKRKLGRNSPVFITHAHGDHIGGLTTNINGYLTAPTKDILLNGDSKKNFENFNSLRYGDEVIVDELKIKTHNAGHILGSAQYEIISDNSTIVYTGDINCRRTLTTIPAEVIPCDTLILETTYGSPWYIFPSLSDIYVSIIKWAISEFQKSRVPTFIVYSVGKAQEIVKIFNEFTSIPVVVSHRIAKINDVYDRNEIKLNYIDATSDEGEELLRKTCVQVISSNEKASVRDNCSFASATGWALKRIVKYYDDVAFPLSGHADFNQLIDYVEHARPREVFTVHGFKKDFANYISRKLGIKAREIPLIMQSMLKSFI